MLTLTPPGPPLPRAYVDAAGGFGWWYVDVVDEQGNGVVVIAAFGLPFLPGLAGAARRGAPVLPTTRPAVNLAVYERGRCTWYGLLELPAAAAALAVQEPGALDAAREGPASPPPPTESVVLGDSRFERRVVDDEATFTAHLDLALPVGRARGTVVVRGRARGTREHGLHTAGTPPPPGTLPPHSWSPQILHARGHVDLTLRSGGAERRVVVDGAGYHDRNGGLAPLHDLGIAWWTWGRAAFADEERVVYALWPTAGTGGTGGPGNTGDAPGPVAAFGLVVDDRGSRLVPGLQVELGRAPTNWLGLRRVDAAVFRTPDGGVFLRGRAVHVVDDGPFYARALWAADRGDGDGAADVTNGVVETVDPHRVDIPWQRPFVRMRVTPPPPTSPSIWHPLFAGDATGRVGRLWRTWLRGAP